MASELLPELGSTVTIRKADLNVILGRLRERGFQTLGPRLANGSVIYDTLEAIQDLPHGHTTEQAPGHFRVQEDRAVGYFGFVPGAHSWKQFLFPSRTELFELRKNGRGWELQESASETPKYAFIGVRACELAAIQIQDGIFLRADFQDPIYRARRERVFILSVNCLTPAGTCFCASLGTGPRVHSGFDLNLTELAEVFVLTIGSEVGRSLLADIPYENASGFVLSSVDRALERAAHEMGRSLETNDLPGLLLDNLDNPYWQEVGKRCLSCANCTQVCPTCFCWDATDQMSLDGKATQRERVWDSCFNPGYSYHASGNTRPSIESRYRQWLSHKFGTWKQQYGSLGCVGCGRCITWCPAGIDVTEEIANLRKEAGK